jgi:hypothetical protein
MTDSYAASPLLQETKTPGVKPEYKTRTYAGKGGDISNARPGGDSLNRRKTTGAVFQKARKQRK